MHVNLIGNWADCDFLCSKSAFGQTMTPDEQNKLKDEVRRFTLGDISQWLEGLDREFLTVLRTE